jgi:hypothetical protein
VDPGSTRPVVAIGVDPRLDGFALVGVRLIPARTGDEIESAWAGLGDDVGLVVLSAEAARTLEPVLADRDDLLTVVLP